MIPQPIERAHIQLFFMIVGFLILFFGLLIFFLFFVRKREGKRGDTCPYHNETMRFGMDVARSLAGVVNAFLVDQPQPENPPIDFFKASYCPVSGRIFPNTVLEGERVRLGWEFLRKRWPGTYISWGSLSEDEQGVIRLLHDSLEGFQMECSSTKIRPEDVEQDFLELAPGPLYIDRQTKVLIGWKKVPGTYFEVLVVQQPKFQTIDETL